MSFSRRTLWSVRARIGIGVVYQRHCCKGGHCLYVNPLVCNGQCSVAMIRVWDALWYRILRMRLVPAENPNPRELDLRAWRYDATPG